MKPHRGLFGRAFELKPKFLIPKEVSGDKKPSLGLSAIEGRQGRGEDLYQIWFFVLEQARCGKDRARWGKYFLGGEGREAPCCTQGCREVRPMPAVGIDNSGFLTFQVLWLPTKSKSQHSRL